jgi:hypothetical protein
MTHLQFAPLITTGLADGLRSSFATLFAMTGKAKRPAAGCMPRQWPLAADCLHHQAVFYIFRRITAGGNLQRGRAAGK